MDRKNTVRKVNKPEYNNHTKIHRVKKFHLEPEVCPKCHGSGALGDSVCSVCMGLGEVME